MKRTLPLIFFLFSFSFSGFSQLNCALTYVTTIEGFNVYKHNASGAILYRAKFAVDADGSPRAYGPNDSGLDWTANAGYPGNWWGIVTDQNGDPVIQGSGDPYPGMYVSTTSLVQSGYATTNPLRYVNSEVIPYIALPSALQSLGNIAKGDFAYAKNITTGDSSFAYFADSGPAGKLGEGSMLLATRLGLNNSPKYGGTSQQIIDYVVFPQSGFGQGTQLTAAQIDSIGEQVLLAAGGYGLTGCLDNQFTLNCSNTIPLSCGVTYNGTSSSAPSLVGTYSCNNWTESGPERVHSIIPSANGTITATLSNFTGDLDVYILADCNPNNCLGTVSSSSATFANAIAGETYYIVVDADDGSGGAYDLLVSCPASASTEDITLTNATLFSAQVSAGDTISVSVIQNYTGSNPVSVLPAFDIGYYLSTDCNLSIDDTLLGADSSDIGSDVPSSSESATLLIPASTAAGNYYILFVADKNNEVQESNEGNNIVCLSVTINSLILDCFNAVSLACGVNYQGASSAAASNVNTYGCNNWTETGPERVHSIVPQANGTITASLSNFTGDLDVYILAGCDPANCVGTVSASSATLNNAVAGVTYYIVVDADDGSGSAYDLVVTCPVNPCQPQTINQQSAICNGDSIFLEGNYQSTAGTYYDTLQTVNGCDSVVETNLMVNSVFSNQYSVSICNGDSIFLQGNYQTTAGTYYDTLQTVNGCDSIVETILTVNSVFSNQYSVSICNGDSIFLQGNYQTTAGVYYDSLQTINGCDSFIATTLTILQSTSSTLYETVCDGYTLNSTTYNSSGTYTQILINADGCDSMLTLNLTINQSAVSSQQLAICNGDSILLQGGYQTISGTYYDSLQSVNGCDSVIVTTLVVNSNPIISLFSTPDSGNANGTAAVVASGGTVPYGYLWSNGGQTQGIASLQAGMYYVTVTDANGCDMVDSVFVDFYSGMKGEGSPKTEVIIIPNPNKGEFVVQITDKNGFTDYRLQIYNMLGEVVYKSQILNPQSQIEIDLGKTTSGVYYVQVVSEKGVMTKRVAVE